MNKIIIVSDSHGQLVELENIYNHFKKEASLFLHCGDSELDHNHQIFNHYQTVRGNCDNKSHDSELLLDIYEHKILVVHGHKQHVKFGLNKLFYYALEKGADIVCFGHSHYPFVQKHENITFINPGSIYANRSVRGKSFAVIEILNKDITVKHLDALTYKEYKW